MIPKKLYLEIRESFRTVDFIKICQNHEITTDDYMEAYEHWDPVCFRHFMENINYETSKTNT